MANWKITTGRLAIGAFMSVLKNWLFSAVNSSGAVSPLTRAMASRMPVTTPALTARSVTMQRSPSSAARRARTPLRAGWSGTRCSMSSVVRTTTGMAISASATTPAQPEKPPDVRHAAGHRRTGRSTIDGADSMMSVTKRVVRGELGRRAELGQIDAGQNADRRRRPAWRRR